MLSNHSGIGPVVSGWFCSPCPTLELPGVGQVLLMTLFPSSGNCPRKTPEEIQQSQHNHFVMWESDVTVRWRSFTQDDAGMRQGWTRCWRQGGHVHSTEKPHWKQEQVSLRVALVITGMHVVPGQGPWHPVTLSTHPVTLSTHPEHPPCAPGSRIPGPAPDRSAVPAVTRAGHGCKAALAPQQRVWGCVSLEGVAPPVPPALLSPAPALLCSLPCGAVGGLSVHGWRADLYIPRLSPLCSGAALMGQSRTHSRLAPALP